MISTLYACFVLPVIQLLQIIWQSVLSLLLPQRDDKYDLFPASFLHNLSPTSKTIRECSTAKDCHYELGMDQSGKPIFTLSEANMVPYQQQPSPFSDLSKSPNNSNIQTNTNTSGNSSGKTNENNNISHIQSHGNSNMSDNTLDSKVNEKFTETINDAGFILLSPVSSVKSDNSDISVAQNGSSLTTVSSNDESCDSHGEEGEIVEGDANGGKAYKCPYCPTKFKIRGYLTRHLKKHSKEKAYCCPFHDPDSKSKCHSTGGFSRRDTYKTHLKARHFKYPPGIRSSDRTGMVGWCGICGERFLNNEIWVERHIEGGKCPGLPKSYVESLKPGKKKTGKHSKFLDVQNVNESIQLGTNNKDLGEIVKKLHMASPMSVTESPSPMSYFPASTASTTPQMQPQMQLQPQLQHQHQQQPKPPVKMPHEVQIQQQSFLQMPPQGQNNLFISDQLEHQQKADMEVMALLRRKMEIQQRIMQLQKQAFINNSANFDYVNTGAGSATVGLAPEDSYAGLMSPLSYNQYAPALNFNPNCFQRKEDQYEKEEEEEYHTLDTEYVLLSEMPSSSTQQFNCGQAHVEGRRMMEMEGLALK
ncbi:Stp2 protein [Martiniozyma asiatica (nom. inval.)]|nr:Stp2 protein [Martiniozyma asiatica]